MPQTTMLTEGTVRLVVIGGSLVWTVKCPRCNRWNAISDAQMRGALPIQCRKVTCSFEVCADLHDLADWGKGRVPK